MSSYELDLKNRQIEELRVLYQKTEYRLTQTERTLHEAEEEIHRLQSRLNEYAKKEFSRGID